MEGVKYRERVKQKLRRARQRALLTNIDNTLRQEQEDEDSNEDPNDQEEEEGDDDDDMIDLDVAEDGLVADIEEILYAAGEGNEQDVDEFCRMNWRDDVGERGRSIYEWWRVAMNARRSDVIPSFYKAVQLVALSQASSAAVERVFSQLTFIRRVVGDSTVRDMLELRAFFRCNNKLVGDYKVKI